MKTRDDQLTELLDSLPQVAATDAFTASVVSEASRRSPRRYKARLRRRWVAAALLAVGLGSTLGLGLHRRMETPQVQSASVDDLIRQQRQIEAELNQLRRLAAETAPVAYVAGDEHVDIVLDLRSVDRKRTTAQPAVYRPERN